MTTTTKVIEEMTIKELENYFNYLIKGLTYTSIEPSLTRGYMIDEIRDKCGGFNISSYLTNDSEISIKICGVNVKFKVSVKGNGEYISVSKTKNKEVKGVGKLKFLSAGFNLGGLCCWSLDENKKLVKDGGYIFEDCTKINFMYSDNIAFKDMWSKTTINSKLDHDKLDSELKILMIQPYVKNTMFEFNHPDTEINKDKLKKHLSNEIYDELPNKLTHQMFWDQIINLVGIFNSDLIKDLKEEMYNKKE